jgi:hypothetical protein
MAITKIPANPNQFSEKKIQKFIDEAPDGRKPKRIFRGKKVQISITLDEAMIEKVEAMAKRLGQSRTGFISLAVAQALEKGLRLD